MARYTIIYQNQAVGPMELHQLRAYGITPQTMISVDGGPWVPAYSIPEVMSIINSNPPAFSGGTSGKDHIVGGLLAIFLGGLGVQYFYCGKTTGGIICLLLTLVTCGLWEIVTFIQGICMLTMDQAKFDDKYVNTPSQFPVF